MEACNCVEAWFTDELLMMCQYISDFFIAIAYFSIALEIVYFVKKSIVFPHRGVLVQFGAFIVLCGITHLINLWTLGMHTRTIAIIMASSKILTAAVSCGTAIMLVHIIPDLLNIKTRELSLKNKADELDHEKGLIRTEEETSRHVRMLTHEIRRTLDKHIILNTTLVEFGRALGLEECGLWMPTRTGQELQLTYTLSNQDSFGFKVPIQSPAIIQVFSNDHAVIISANSPVAKLRHIAGNRLGEVAAVRIPLLHHSESGVCDWSELSTERYALMVLILPMDSARQWHSHELELVEAVADQVTVALSHAAYIEESMKENDTLMEQNAELDLANREEETSVRALNDFLVVMNHEMATHIHAICLLSSLMQETDMTSEIRLMVERILKSTNFLATLKNDASEISCLEDGILQLDIAAFNLHTLFKEVLNLVKPVASVKRLFIALNLASDLPENVIGDEKRLLQVILNIVGNAVKFSKEGSILISAFNSKEQSLRDRSGPDLHPVPSDGHFYLRMQVKDSGSGISPQDIPKLFTKFAESQSIGTKDFHGSGLGLAISKRIVNLMEGEIGIESKGLGEGTTVNFIVKLGVPAHSRLP